jgi:hypothetical protein
VRALATLARLTYDYPLSERLDPRLFSTALSDGYAVHVRIVLALQFDEYGNKCCRWMASCLAR